IFGVPGGPSVFYMEAFRQAGIRFILVSDERSAGFMACVSGSLTGIPGVCHSTLGPGATNLTTGAGGALLDRCPVIVLTSEIPEKWINRTAQMNINHQALFTPVTKASYRLTAENVQKVLPLSLKHCREEYPGPVHLGLPADIATMEINRNEEEIISFNQTPENNNITEIINIIRQSKNPIIAVGLTSARLRLAGSVDKLLKNFHVPVLLTPMAKGVLDENHPCYAGVLSHALSDHLQDIYSHTDLVIGLGYDPVECNYESWMPQVPLIHFDTKISDLPDNRNIFRFIGSPMEWFNVLDKIILTSEIIKSGLIKKVRDEMDSVFTEFTSRFGPVTALKILRETLPADTIITTDVGSHLHLIGQYWKTYGLQNLIMTNGWSSMGFGLPAAIAAKLVRPASRVVCITGDGGFLMSAGEIVTAQRCMTPVIVVIFSDGQLNLIKLKQMWQNFQPTGIHLYSGDMFHAGRFLNTRVLNVTSEKTLRDALEYAMTLNDTVIINAMIDPDDYKWLIERQQL
ncbi:MAG: thiamine pyrophosphate-binding protein, partial [bacterium]